MGTFSVHTATVRGHAVRLSAIAPGVRALHAGAAPHASAGAGTRGAGAVTDSFAAWSQALPHYALAADRLTAAMIAASDQYERADATVQAASS